MLANLKPTAECFAESFRKSFSEVNRVRIEGNFSPYTYF